MNEKQEDKAAIEGKGFDTPFNVAALTAIDGNKILSTINHIIDELDVQDAEGHIWWGKFKDMILASPSPVQGMDEKYLVDLIEGFGDYYSSYKNIDPPKGITTIIQEYLRYGMECEKCHGEGEIEKNIQRAGYPEMDVPVICDECNGTGKKSVQGISKEGEKVCTGCGHVSTDLIQPPYLSCCPDSNYLPLREFIEEWRTEIESAKKKVVAITKEGYWQLCPKCNGQGTTAKPPYVPGDVNEWVSTTDRHTCDVCFGEKIIAAPPGQSQTEPDKGIGYSHNEGWDLMDMH